MKPMQLQQETHRERESKEVEEDHMIREVKDPRHDPLHKKKHKKVSFFPSRISYHKVWIAIFLHRVYPANNPVQSLH